MTEEKQTENRLTIAKIYTKDLSFESPQAPKVFQSGEWQPQTNLNLRTTHRKVDEESLYEMVLTLTLDAKLDEETKLGDGRDNTFKLITHMIAQVADVQGPRVVDKSAGQGFAHGLHGLVVDAGHGALSGGKKAHDGQ